MELDIDKIEKTVIVWVKNGEKDNAAIQEKLKEIYGKYKKQYTVAVFLSGNGNLFENTRELLLHNSAHNIKRELTHN